MHKSMQRYLIILGALFLFSPQGNALNGFIPHYVGAHGITGGAGMAAPYEASNVVTNPASIGVLPSHVLLMAGLHLKDQYVDSSQAQLGNKFGKMRNLHDMTPIGSVGANLRLNNYWAIGVGVSGGGAEAKYSQPVTNPDRLVPAGSTSYDKEARNNVILTVPSIAYAPDSNHSYGVGILIGHSTFRSNLSKQGANFTFPQRDGRGRADTAYGLGVRFGLLYKLTEYFSLGSSISTPVYFQKHKKYADLFPEPIEIPASFLIGMKLKLTDSLEFLFDFKQLYYGFSPWLRKGQGWRNQTILLAGLQYTVNEKLVVGCGYNYGAAVINQNKVFVNATALPIEEHHISGGFRYKFMPKKEFILVGFFTAPSSLTDDGGFIPQVAGTKIFSRTCGFEAGFKFDF